MRVPDTQQVAFVEPMIDLDVELVVRAGINPGNKKVIVLGIAQRTHGLVGLGE